MLGQPTDYLDGRGSRPELLYNISFNDRCIAKDESVYYVPVFKCKPTSSIPVENVNVVLNIILEQVELWYNEISVEDRKRVIVAITRIKDNFSVRNIKAGIELEYEDIQPIEKMSDQDVYAVYLSELVERVALLSDPAMYYLGRTKIAYGEQSAIADVTRGMVVNGNELLIVTKYTCIERMYLPYSSDRTETQVLTRETDIFTKFDKPAVVKLI